eukprot:CAMPEP_0177580182 /NCGR_PEP_ID=MMETSP0419_2-20121207/1411_1 /TAXON_ID=582737 /ORGANISM="Tetraselmis sp., Strain GSL018" /LENGTH=59 /DNA_ID=CAMNT_0019069007 /DNA_START=270 /DNA_END=445 /DNA_ORIENTATION=-
MAHSRAGTSRTAPRGQQWEEGDCSGRWKHAVIPLTVALLAKEGLDGLSAGPACAKGSYP